MMTEIEFTVEPIELAIEDFFLPLYGLYFIKLFLFKLDHFVIAKAIQNYIQESAFLSYYEIYISKLFDSASAVFLY